jgi:hypothetical protein
VNPLRVGSWQWGVDESRAKHLPERRPESGAAMMLLSETERIPTEPSVGWTTEGDTSFYVELVSRCRHSPCAGPLLLRFRAHIVRPQRIACAQLASNVDIDQDAVSSGQSRS